ncbi:MAG: hypothetical protein GY708_02875 [Actinomycetia bacterium]|nr:hypothetical protein [Actinomycetes bacterium]MCP4959925.1 hypothetical protein [Actinomycetes bacterium]
MFGGAPTGVAAYPNVNALVRRDGWGSVSSRFETALAAALVGIEESIEPARAGG